MKKYLLSISLQGASQSKSSADRLVSQTGYEAGHTVLLQKLFWLQLLCGWKNTGENDIETLSKPVT